MNVEMIIEKGFQKPSMVPFVVLIQSPSSATSGGIYSAKVALLVLETFFKTSDATE